MEPVAQETQASARLALARRTAAALLAALAVTAAGCGDDSPSATADQPASTSPTTGATTPAAAEPLASSAAHVRKALRGIPQAHLVLGRARAPLTIVEYGGFDCPACAATHAAVVPELIDRYVRTGKASLEFRGLAGESASRARDLALGTLAASEQHKGWEFLELAYRRQLEGGEAAAKDETEPPKKLAGALGLDVRRWGDQVGDPAWPTELVAANNVAAISRFSTLPVFLVRARDRADEPFVIVTAPGTIQALTAALEKAAKPAG